MSQARAARQAPIPPSVEFTECSPLVEAIAQRVVELLHGVEPAGHELAWTTARVAEVLGRSEEWVRDHRQELGVLPANGARPRLLFDPAAVRAWATARECIVRSETADTAPPLPIRGRGRQRMSSGPDLLPIRGQERAA